MLVLINAAVQHVSAGVSFTPFASHPEPYYFCLVYLDQAAACGEAFWSVS